MGYDRAFIENTLRCWWNIFRLLFRRIVYYLAVEKMMFIISSLYLGFGLFAGYLIGEIIYGD